MAVSAIPIIASKQAESTQTTQYTANNCTTIIDKFTATNISAANVTISINLVLSGDTPDSTNLIVDARTLAPNETYTFPELVGHILAPSGFISTIAGQASAIVIRASGREIT